MLNSHYLFIIYLDYIKTRLKKRKHKTKMIFKKTKKRTKKYTNAPKIE